jgi:hypothetical protein
MASYDQALRLVTQSNIVAQGVAAASMTVLKSVLPWACKVKGTITGGSQNTGTITITGTVGGTPGTTETLTFTQAQWVLGNKLFTTISAITTSGLADESTKPTVKVEACDSSGNPKYWTNTTEDYYACSFKPVQLTGSGAYKFQLEGKTANQLYLCKSDEDIPIEAGSKFSIDDLNDLAGDLMIFQAWSIDTPAMKSGGLKIGISFLAVRESP